MSFLQKCLVTVAMGWHLAGCSTILGIEDLPEVGPDAAPPAVYTVRGTAVGLLAPVSLRLEHPDGFELLTVEQDGTFAFQAQLGEGAIYSVTLLGDPPCVLEDASGAVQGDIPILALVCERAALSALEVSGPVAPRLNFKPLRRDYEVPISLLQQRVQITATALSPQATITIAGTPAESGVPSEPIVLAMGDNGIEVVVDHPDGEQRVYRLNVTRTSTPEQYVYGKSSEPEESASFGTSVALWKDTLAVGAFKDGEVQIFRGVRGAWLQEARLEAAPGPVGANVALWEDTLTVGSSGADVSGMENSGRVHVYQRQDGFWMFQDAPISSNLEAGDGFGASAALWGDTLVVGAPGEDSAAIGIGSSQSDNGAESSGAVYVYQRIDNAFRDEWQQVAYLKASNTDAGDSFGASVALWGDILVVGAPGEDSAATGINGNQSSDSAEDSGAVYVFRRTSTSWVQETYLKASNNNAGDRFGDSVAIWEDMLVVGARAEDSAATGINGDQSNNDARDSGAVYLFRGVGTSWTQEAYLKASNNSPDDQFGNSVAVWGNTVAIGAFREDGGAAGINGDPNNDDEPNSGAVYLFQRTGASWMQTAYIKASNPGGSHAPWPNPLIGDEFGRSVALGDGTLAAGAWLEHGGSAGINGDQSDNSVAFSGAAYIFH